MAQFNFTTNIEKRMPATGKVFCIDRMTSDYAQAHPFDVDAFIESVYQEFAGTEFEESREVLRSVWTSVLSVTSPCGDASLYPNKNEQHRPAAMKVWHKAGDYWRRGLRLGDTLPDMVPMTKITRLDDGSWIALFPKDMQLMDDGRCKMEEVVETTEPAEPEVIETTTDYTDGTDDEPFLRPDSSKRPKAERTMNPEPLTVNQPRPRRQRKPRVERQEPLTIDHSPLTVNRHQSSSTLKAVGMVAAATVALFVIYETGLLIPLGLIGLATGGILK